MTVYKRQNFPFALGYMTTAYLLRVNKEWSKSGWVVKIQPL